jgi:Ternary complex associated domain 9
VNSTRNRVVWLGRRVPEELRQIATVLGFSVQAVIEVESVDATAPDLLAVFVSGAGDDEKRKAFGRLLRLAKEMHLLDYGVLLGIASKDLAFAITLRRQVIDTFSNEQIERAPLVSLSISVEDFATVLRSHNPGPSINLTLPNPLPGHIRTKNYQYYESDSILLRRAFEGFTRVKLTTEKGGFSKDCRVWRVDAHHGAGLCEPFVAKAARRGDLEAEFRTYCDLVRNFVPFPFRAPLLEAQFVKGATRAVLVSAFVSRSQRLDKYLAAVSSPELVMVSLFEGALGNWRRAAVRETASLARASLLLPNPKDLTSAFYRAQEAGDSVIPPSELCSKLESLPPSEHFFCRVHGDLNIRNVFVRWNTTDTVLIDFSNSGSRGPVARDPAKLETSISLVARDADSKLLPDTVLRELYRGPLLPPRNFRPVDGRTDAIRQIRSQAGGEGIRCDEYEVLVICHLLRFACKPDPANKDQNTDELRHRRALSYALSCKLFRGLSS